MTHSFPRRFRGSSRTRRGTSHQHELPRSFLRRVRLGTPSRVLPPLVASRASRPPGARVVQLLLDAVCFPQCDHGGKDWQGKNRIPPQLSHLSFLLPTEVARGPVSLGVISHWVKRRNRSATAHRSELSLLAFGSLGRRAPAVLDGRPNSKAVDDLSLWTSKKPGASPTNHRVCRLWCCRRAV